jgi:hypothetical protein
MDPQGLEIQSTLSIMSRAQDTREVVKSGLGLLPLFLYQGGPLDLTRANMIPLSTLVHMQLKKFGVSVPLVEPTHTGALSGHSAL